MHILRIALPTTILSTPKFSPFRVRSTANRRFVLLVMDVISIRELREHWWKGTYEFQTITRLQTHVTGILYPMKLEIFSAGFGV
jgi:hypothetical protein